MNSKMKQLKNEKGFTIIEVVLVLAIAGLIFLMVFIALPALQRSQRDTARKNDVSTVAAAVTSYSSNNKGVFPSGNVLDNYVTNKSDNTTTITIRTAGAATFTPSDGTVYVTQKTTCGTNTSPESQVLATGTNRQFTTVTRLEAGGGSSFCLDS